MWIKCCTEQTIQSSVEQDFIGCKSVQECSCSSCCRTPFQIPRVNFVWTCCIAQGQKHRNKSRWAVSSSCFYSPLASVASLLNIWSISCQLSKMRKNSEKVPAALGDLVTPMQPAVDLALPKHVRNRQISTLLILIHIYTYYFHIISIFTVSFPFSNIQLQTLFAPWVLRAGPPAKSPGIWTSHGFPHQMASFCTSPNPRRHWLPQPAENWCFNPRNKKNKKPNET